MGRLDFRGLIGEKSGDPLFPGPIPAVCGSPVGVGGRVKCQNSYIRFPTLKGISDTLHNVSLRVQPGNPDFNRTRTEMGTVKDALKVGIKI